MPKKIRGLNSGLVLFLIVLFVVIVNVFWIKLNTNIIMADELAHYSQTLLLKEKVDQARTPMQFLNALLTTNSFHPPFVYWITLIFYTLFSGSRLVFEYMHLLYMVIFIIGIFDCTRQVWSEKTALLTAFFAALNPLILTLSRHYTLDFPIAALCPITLAFLIRSKGFRERKWAVFAGVLFAIGTLIKWTFAIYILPGALYLLIKAVLEDKDINLRKKIFGNLIVFLLCILVIAGPWYILNFTKIVDNVFHFGIDQAAIEKDPPVTSFAALSFYLWSVKGHSFYPIFLMGLFGIGLSIVNREYREKNFIFLLSFFVPLILFTVLSNKDARYFVSAFFPFYLLALFFVEPLSKKWKGWKFITAGLVIFTVIRVSTFWLPLCCPENAVVKRLARKEEYPPLRITYHETLRVLGNLTPSDFLPYKSLYLIGMPPTDNKFEENVVKLLKIVANDVDNTDTECPEIACYLEGGTINSDNVFLSMAIPVYARLNGIELGYHISKTLKNEYDADFIIFTSQSIRPISIDGFKLEKQYGQEEDYNLFLYRVIEKEFDDVDDEDEDLEDDDHKVKTDRDSYQRERPF